MLTVNASNIDKDWAWVTAHGDGRATWTQRERGDGADRGAGAEGRGGWSGGWPTWT